MAALLGSCAFQVLSARQSRSTAGAHLRSARPRATVRRVCAPPQAALKALLWDCDGVILESEDLHRRAYNAVFEHFKVTVGGARVVWSEEYYDLLSNTGASASCLALAWRSA